MARALGLLLVALMANLLGCSSTETKPVGPPSWTHQPTRTVDNGYIVYIGRGESGTLENAEFKAVGIALEDLANECSMVPKGTRVEDRFVETTATGVTAYSKIAVEFQECDEASKAVDPEAIRKLASEPFTQQVRRYQEYEDTGTAPKANELAQAEPPDEIQPPPPLASSAGGNGNVQFYAVRQYVSYQKQIVILSPSTAYAPGSPRAIQFTNVMAPTVNQTQAIALAHPVYRTDPTPWSALPNRPIINRPVGLRPVSYRQNSVAPIRSGPAAASLSRVEASRAQTQAYRAMPRPAPRRARRRCARGRC